MKMLSSKFLDFKGVVSGNVLIGDWHNQLLVEFFDIGFCYEYDSLPLNPIVLDFGAEKKVRSEIHDLILCARRISLEHINDLSKPRPIHQDLVHSYLASDRRPVIARPDGMIVDGKLKLLELNVDSGLGGVTEISLIQKYQRKSQFVKNKNLIMPDPLEHQVKFVNKIAKTICVKEDSKVNVCIVPYSDFDRLYLDQSEQLAESISQDNDINAFVVFPEALHGGEYLNDGNKNYHIVYRDGCFHHEEIRLRGMKEMLITGQNTKSIILGDPLDLVVEDKGSLALLNTLAGTSCLSDYETYLVGEYIPWTCFADTPKVNYKGNLISTMALMKTEQTSLVLKRTHSHAGECVYIGAETETEEWLDLIQRASSSNHQWIIQENLSSDYMDFCYRTNDSQYIWRKQRFTIGPFIFGEQSGGWLVRVEKNPKNRVLALPTNSESGLTGVAVLQ